jgi:hypothetical protein
VSFRAAGVEKDLDDNRPVQGVRFNVSRRGSWEPDRIWWRLRLDAPPARPVGNLPPASGKSSIAAGPGLALAQRDRPRNPRFRPVRARGGPLGQPSLLPTERALPPSFDPLMSRGDARVKYQLSFRHGRIVPLTTGLHHRRSERAGRCRRLVSRPFGVDARGLALSRRFDRVGSWFVHFSWRSVGSGHLLSRGCVRALRGRA